MGTLTLEQFRDELLFDLKNRTDTGATGLSTTRQTLFVNAAYLHVTHPSVFRHRELQYRYTIPLVAGQATYAFTPNAGVNVTAIRSVAHVDGATDDPTLFRTKLVPQDEQWFQERTLSSSGPPRDYYVQANVIGVGPVPDASVAGELLVVTAWREPTLLVVGASTVLSSLWDEIILLGARWRAELHLGYRDLAEMTKLDFASLLNEYQSFEQLHGEDWDWQSGVRVERTMESV